MLSVSEDQQFLLLSQKWPSMLRGWDFCTPDPLPTLKQSKPPAASVESSWFHTLVLCKKIFLSSLWNTTAKMGGLNKQLH